MKTSENSKKPVKNTKKPLKSSETDLKPSSPTKPKRRKLDSPQAFDSALTELPTATIELDIPKVGKKPTKEQMDNLKKGAEAMAAHEDKMILETLHTPHLTMGSPADDDLHIKMTKEIEDTVKEVLKTPSKYPTGNIKLARPKITDYEWQKEYQNNPHAGEEE